MTDQNPDRLMNPLEEVRRPESSAEKARENALKNLTDTLRMNSTTTNQIVLPALAPLATQFEPTNVPLYPPMLTFNPNPFLPQLGLYYDTDKAAAYYAELQRSQLTPSSLEQLIREREALQHLITPLKEHTNNSSRSQLFPIVISDSDYSAYQSDSSRTDLCSTVMMNRAKEAVEERMQKVQQQQENQLEEKLTRNSRKSPNRIISKKKKRQRRPSNK